MCRACPPSPYGTIASASAEGSRTMPDLPESPYTLWFQHYTEQHRPRVGGKNASLGSMLTAGLPVPPGFAITTEAYDTLRSHPELRAVVHAHLDDLDHRDNQALTEATQVVRKLIEEVPLPPPIERSIHHAYEALCETCDVDDLPVAVRSSATAEDLPEASFAGLQDTFLWIRGGGQVVEHVKRCWSSVFTDRAVAYRRQRGFEHDVIDMAVGVQKMVTPQAAGVAFTLNPSDGDPSQIAIDASWGFGEAVVSGEVTPDNFLVDKVLYEIVSRRISPKTIEYRLNGDAVEVAEVDEERCNAPCLTDDQIRAVARMARRAEKHYGRPQDIEWAIDADLPDGQDVILLQSRPETVWSNKPRKPIATGSSDPLEAIVATLCSPLAARTAKGSEPTSKEGSP